MYCNNIIYIMNTLFILYPTTNTFNIRISLPISWDYFRGSNCSNLYFATSIRRIIIPVATTTTISVAICT